MIYVLRLGHRPTRDKRVSTHVAFVARTFGASGLYYTGMKDNGLEKSVRDVVANWGGDFFIRHIDSWKQFIHDFDGVRVHLTMYGQNINDVIDDIKKQVPKVSTDMLVIVGGEKVPSDVYYLSDYNVAVGNQPHSEIAALAVFLDRWFSGAELDVAFNGKIKIIPQTRGKKIVHT